MGWPCVMGYVFVALLALGLIWLVSWWVYRVEHCRRWLSKWYRIEIGFYEEHRWANPHNKLDRFSTSLEGFKKYSVVKPSDLREVYDYIRPLEERLAALEPKSKPKK